MDKDIIYGETKGQLNNEENHKNDSESLLTNKDTVTPETFKMPEQAEKTLDNYIAKLDEFYSKIGEERIDEISQKAKVLEAILGTDMLKID